MSTLENLKGPENGSNLDKEDKPGEPSNTPSLDRINGALNLSESDLKESKERAHEMLSKSGATEEQIKTKLQEAEENPGQEILVNEGEIESQIESPIDPGMWHNHVTFNKKNGFVVGQDASI